MTAQMQFGAAGPAGGDVLAGASRAMGIRTTVLFGALVSVAFIGGFGAWAALAPLDSAAIAPGVVLVEGKRKTIQHLEGGIVGTILVEEGSEVVQGEHLIWLDETQPRARLDVLRAQMISATALAARLVAERDGAETIAFPESLTSSEEPGAQQAVAGQQRIFEVRRQSLENQIAVLNKRIAQLHEEITGLKLEIRAQDRQLELIKEEADAVEKLVADGLARKPRLLALQREHADILGRRGKNVAAVARAGQAIGETELRIEELTTGRTGQIVEELREVQTEIHDLRERLAAARDVLGRTIIKAPVDGTVVNLQVFTSGGVVSPGEPIMDIVPGAPELVVEARVNPDDIDSVEIGLPAQIRFPAFSQRAAPVFDGTAVRVSADRIDDERTGEPFYLATVRLDADELSATEEYDIQVGMSAEVMIVTGARTMIDYLMSPIKASFSRAMTEQ